MTILLVNDDGIDAEGIKALEDVLSCTHEVWVSAPKRQMSGMSHAMTMHGRIDIERRGRMRYAVAGTPADCILYARCYREALFPHDPDLVISGINNGYNLATDITYSGTCGASREAVYSGWKSMAVSSGGCDFVRAAGFLRDNLDKLYSALDDKSFININFPKNFNGEMKLTIPGELRYSDNVTLLEDNGDIISVRIESTERTDIHVDGYLNDTEACRMGYASVSSVTVINKSSTSGFNALMEHYK